MTGEQLSGRKRLLDKIKALLAKTVAAGCTEAEAMSALDLAQRLMAEWEISGTDLKFGGEQCVMNERDVDDRTQIRKFLAVAVARFCQCETWSKGMYNTTFCGLQS